MITDGLNPFNLLALFALVGGTGVAAWAIGTALIARRELARLFAASLVAGWTVYAAAFLIASLTSRDRVLAPGEEKHLCEIDCHLAYSVVGVQTAPTVGTATARQSAHGLFYIVTVRVRFDSATIGPHREMFPLWPDEHWIDVVDGAGRHYAYSLSAQRALGAGDAPPLTLPLVPGESYTAGLVFEVPADARDLRLEIAAVEPPTWLMIGHENSFLHGKTTFRLPSVGRG